MKSPTQHITDTETRPKRWQRVAAVLVGLVLGLWVVRHQRNNAPQQF